MKHAIKLFLALVLASAAILSVPAASHAQKRDGGRPAASSASPAGAPTQQSWWGEAAAFGCGLGFAYIGTPGFAMFGGFCAIALVDALIS